MTDIEFNDYSDKIMEKLKKAEIMALTAIGEAAIEVTTNYMQKRYGPGSKGAGIWESGDLQRDVNSRVNPDKKEVSIGNSLEYAQWVHNGTRRTTGKPYLFDAATENTDIWQEVGQEQLNKGMR